MFWVDSEKVLHYWGYIIMKLLVIEYKRAISSLKRGFDMAFLLLIGIRQVSNYNYASPLFITILLNMNNSTCSYLACAVDNIFPLFLALIYYMLFWRIAMLVFAYFRLP